MTPRKGTFFRRLFIYSLLSICFFCHVSRTAAAVPYPHGGGSGTGEPCCRNPGKFVCALSSTLILLFSGMYMMLSSNHCPDNSPVAPKFNQTNHTISNFLSQNTSLTNKTQTNSQDCYSPALLFGGLFVMVSSLFGFACPYYIFQTSKRLETERNPA